MSVGYKAGKELGNTLNEILQLVIDGVFPTICACTHGYAFGYIYVGDTQ